MSEKKETMLVDGLGNSGIRSINIDYPSNSHKSRMAEKNEKPKTQKIVTGDIVQRKKPISKKLAEAFVGDNNKGVGQYLLYDILIPAAKDTISDMVTGGMEKLLYGEASSRRNRTKNKNKTYTSYSSYYNGGNEREARGGLSQRNRAQHDFNDIILKSRGEAEEVINVLVDLIEEYDQATVADLYGLVGITAQFTDHKYGWTNLSDAGVSRVREGYLLNLPRPILLED